MERSKSIAEVLVSEQLTRINHQFGVLNDAGIVQCLSQERNLLKDSTSSARLDFEIKTAHPEMLRNSLMTYEFLDAIHILPPLESDRNFGPDLELTLSYNLIHSGDLDKPNTTFDQLVCQVDADDSIIAGSYHIERGAAVDESLQRIVLPPELWKENKPNVPRPAELAIYSLLLPKQPQEGV